MKIISDNNKVMFIEDPRIESLDQFKQELKEENAGVKSFVRPSAWIEELTNNKGK